MTISPFLKAPLRTEQEARLEKINLQYRWTLSYIKGIAEQAEKDNRYANSVISLIAKSAREALSK